ncbi:DUF58 domain-containing protein [Mucisphaera calidilacus]|uniref:DUF58 domain-containing protein n=1 Tax=Mucisphaera calidilacus TaxID=2527982 RepID=A0A518BU68_9BACT|nr:DUF58 domain-containing protein [Mucisphaera calidilacus]QDU70506.1 hypothetical protein Pan265_03340 [Mucisphaera calidilacus]
MPDSGVIDERFLSACRRLRLGALGLRPLPRKAEAPAPMEGLGLDYRDHRPYVTGDDPRRIDWPLYQRSGRLFIRLYDESHQLGVLILLDCSASMGFEASPRLLAGQQAAVAIAAAGLEELNRVHVQPFADGRLLGAPVAANSRARLSDLAHSVSGWRAKQGAQTRLSPVFDAVRRAGHPRLLMVVISDFFDPAGVDDWVPAIKETGHLPALIQLTRASDRDPGVEGSVEVEDCETAERLYVHASAVMMRAYRDAYGRFDRSMQAAARAVMGRRITLDADRSVLTQLGRLAGPGRLQFGAVAAGVR